MKFFRTAETAELDRPTAARADMREFVRREFVTPRRQPDDDGEPALGNLDLLMQRVAGSSLQCIDEVIRELQILRRKLCAESERVQREVVEYASLSQAAAQSTRIITESLGHWKKPPDLPSMSA